MRPTGAITACRASHRVLTDALLPLTDTDFRQPSLLPNYTRGHVVTHVANKARAHVWVFGGPSVGETRRLHPVGYDADTAADAGAHRSADALRADLTESLALVELAWDGLDDELWDREALMTAGPRTMIEIVRHHRRNIEVHHLDLDIGYQPADWPNDFVEGELTKRLSDLPARASHADLLAWLMGRAAAPELHGTW